jgi:hypothetical protein
MRNTFDRRKGTGLPVSSRLQTAIGLLVAAALLSGCAVVLPPPSIEPPATFSGESTPAPAPMLPKLQPVKRSALIRYMALQSIQPSASVSSVSVSTLADQWGSADVPEPPVKKSLVGIARSRGYALGDSIWLQYSAASQMAELLGYDAKTRSWVLLAFRRGGGNAPLTEAR